MLCDKQINANKNITNDQHMITIKYKSKVDLLKKYYIKKQEMHNHINIKKEIY